MNAAYALVNSALWILSPGAGPESYLGIQTATPAFADW